MVKEKEITCQQALRNALMTEFPDCEYAIGKYKEDAVCLQKKEDKWAVYNGYRNTQDNLSLYGNIVDACLDMLQRLCAGDSCCLQQMKEIFYGTAIADKIA